ncbi:MAG TPA: tRNA (adenosine(37)-N6)-threonylcarbamoyltransferase complex transferase subunit TsaD [Solirubrobacteraceae bacterium]|nr:tRNA (adenosine(37)-N6)-threonylcarbamoyltransferase complex transferase subunit TsaD [Solirubrobacteraceae bacterium]
MSILALETSCDDTCAAVLAPDGSIAANVISSQHVHDRFGGVVPEIASRHHLELVNLVVARALAEAHIALEDVQLLAATQGPGLVGALLVGLSTAKSIACARELPFVPVDHLQGHVAANFLATPQTPAPFAPPFVCLIASGGHTLLAHVSDHHSYETLGATLDDAAGEAFDKGARMLGLGFPGGPALERLARDGDPDAFSFPGSDADRSRGGRGAARQRFERTLNFSFAGLKTALLYAIRDLGPHARDRAADLAASYQAAIVDRLLQRCAQALHATGLHRLAIGGGVACNGELRRRLAELGVDLHLPPPALCTDNAAMIASAARFAPAIPFPHYLHLDAYASGERPPDHSHALTHPSSLASPAPAIAP